MASDHSSPIILIGAARSGTKFLRDILASGSGTASVPYDVNYVWRYGAENAPNDILDPENLTSKQTMFIKKTLRSLARAEVDDVLIEKTVSNTLRIPYIEAVYPNARYVHLIRDGRDVVESAMRQWEAPPNWSALRQKLKDVPLKNVSYVWWFGYNFLTGLLSKRSGGKVWGPRYPGIDDDVKRLPLATVCAKQWAASITTAQRDLAIIDPNRAFEIRYEDIVADESALSNLVDALGLPDSNKILEARRNKLQMPSKSRWNDLSVDQQSEIHAQIVTVLENLGYLR